MNYSTLLIDVDNTLLDFYSSERVALKNALIKYGIFADDSTVSIYSAINDSFWKKFENGEIEKNEIYIGRFKEFVLRMGYPISPESLSRTYKEELANGFHKIKDADEILSYLSERYDVYYITNGDSIVQNRRMRGADILKYAKNVFISEDIGVGKPDKRYFNYVLSSVDEKDKNKILVIGDSMSSDILGGINAELDTCWVDFSREDRKYLTQYTVNNLIELKKIL